MTPAGKIVARLLARGITLKPDGKVLVVRPAGAVTRDEVVVLKRHKAEVLALLTAPQSVPSLDPGTVREVLGDPPDEHMLGCVRLDVLAALRQLEVEITTGALSTHPLVVCGRPLADWLALDEVARLVRVGAR